MTPSAPTTHIVVAVFNAAFFAAVLKRPTLTACVTSLVIKQVKQLGQGRDVPAEQVPAGLGLARKDLERLQPPRDDHEADESAAAREIRLEAWRKGEAGLIQAVEAGCFPVLQEFRWDADPPLYDAATGAPFTLANGDASQETDVWLALGRSCSKLRSLIVLDAAEYNLQRTGTEGAFETVGLLGEHGAAALKHIRPVHDSSLFDAIKGLTSFQYRCYSYKHGSDPVPGDRLCRMLASCPELEELDLTLSVYGVRGLRDAEEPMYSASLDALLSLDAGAVLPHLRSLKLLGFRAAPDVARCFFGAHPRLTYVRIGHEGWAEPQDDFGQCEVTDLPMGLLPNVRDFFVHGMEKAWEVARKDGTRRPLAT